MEHEVRPGGDPDPREEQGLPSQPAQIPAIPTAVERDMGPAAISAANRRHEERHGGLEGIRELREPSAPRERSPSAEAPPPIPP